MSFRKEVRAFMRKMELIFIKEKTIIQEQSRMILSLETMNRELLNRLMARDYPELQTYNLTQDKKEDEVDLDFEHDENLAGTEVDPSNPEDAE